MTVSALGSVTVGGATVGFTAAFSALLQALLDAKAAIKVQADLVLDAKDSIRLAALADIQAQLDASFAIATELQVGVTNPALYIQGLVTGLATVEGDIKALVPEIAIAGSVSANAAIAAELKAKIAAFDLVLGVLLSINAALLAVIQILLGPINATASVAVALTAGVGPAGIALYAVDGTAAGLGAQITTALSGGITGGTGGSAAVNALLLVTESSDTYAAMGVVLKTS